LLPSFEGNRESRKRSTVADVVPVSVVRMTLLKSLVCAAVAKDQPEVEEEEEDW